MPFDDLDLEFEDEDELAKKKKNDAVHQDLDLEFQAPEGARPRPVQAALKVQGMGPNHTSAGTSSGRIVKNTMGEVNKQNPTQAKGVTSSLSVVALQPKIHGSNAIKEDFDLGSNEVFQLREQMHRVEFQAEVKVQVAEFKTVILSELAGDMKLMEHQISQLLTRIHAKHPDIKQEALLIKKLLADFTSKKRK